MQITITARQTYGETRFYPACEAARVFADIAGTKTLTLETLRLVKRLGYAVVIDGEATVTALLPL